MAIVSSESVGPKNVTVYEWDSDSGWKFRSANQVGETTAVALNHDGAVMAISAPFESVPGETRDTTISRAGRVQVFLYDFAVTYRPLGQELHGSTEGGFFGHSLALSYTGRTIAIGAPLFVAPGDASQTGEVRVFEFSSTQLRWLLVGSPLRGMESEDWFGYAISIAQVAPGQGSSAQFTARPVTLAISAPHTRETGGYVHVFQFLGEEWQMMGRDLDIANQDVDPTLPYDLEDEFGEFLSLVPTNETYRLAVGSPQKDADARTEDSGMVVVYEYNIYDSRWALLGSPLLSMNQRDELGRSGKLLDQGNLLVAGSPGANSDQGLVRFFRYDGTDFVAEEDSIVEGSASYVEFGRSVDAARRSDKKLVVSAVAVSGSYTVILEQS